MTRRAKIVCTLGPATSSEEAVAALLEAGMNVARMNFSHGDHAEHEVVYHRLRDAAKRRGQALAVIHQSASTRSQRLSRRVIEMRRSRIPTGAADGLPASADTDQ